MYVCVNVRLYNIVRTEQVGTQVMHTYIHTYIHTCTHVMLHKNIDFQAYVLLMFTCVCVCVCASFLPSESSKIHPYPHTHTHCMYVFLQRSRNWLSCRHSCLRKARKSIHTHNHTHTHTHMTCIYFYRGLTNGSRGVVLSFSMIENPSVHIHTHRT